MKNLIKYTSISLLMSIVLSSCVTITKRHTNKGYYIATSSLKHQSSSSKEKEIELAETKTPAKIEVTETTFVQENKVPPIEVQKNAETVNNDQNLPVGGQASSTETAPLHQKQALSKQVKSVKEQLSHPLKMHSNSKKMTASAPVAGDLSLVWIIIIILLVLWALGLLAGGLGIGGLIHLLLIIALVLLILWLLRII